MIRIGFDPVLEAQQRQRELLKEVEQYRLIREASAGKDSKARLSIEIPVRDRERNSLFRRQPARTFWRKNPA